METMASYALLWEAPACSEKHDEFQLYCNPIPLISEILLANSSCLLQSYIQYLVNNITEHNSKLHYSFSFYILWGFVVVVAVIFPSFCDSIIN